jgi:D-amino-acid oxidase
MALAEQMCLRAIDLCPHLVPEGAGIEALRVINHQVGFRPVRKDGPRVEWIPLEKELSYSAGLMDSTSMKGDKCIIHAYGFGHSGYQRSWGVAQSVMIYTIIALDLK